MYCLDYWSMFIVVSISLLYSLVLDHQSIVDDLVLVFPPPEMGVAEGDPQSILEYSGGAVACGVVAVLVLRPSEGAKG